MLNEHGEVHGLLGVRRAIEPKIGEIALPGGFVEAGADWRDELVREVRKGTSISLQTFDLSKVWAVEVMSTPNGRELIILGRTDPVPWEEFKLAGGTDEASEVVAITGPMNMAFPMHTVAVKKFFEALDTIKANRGT